MIKIPDPIADHPLKDILTMTDTKTNTLVANNPKKY